MYKILIKGPSLRDALVRMELQGLCDWHRTESRCRRYGLQGRDLRPGRDATRLQTRSAATTRRAPFLSFRGWPATRSVGQNAAAQVAGDPEGRIEVASNLHW